MNENEFVSFFEDVNKLLGEDPDKISGGLKAAEKGESSLGLLRLVVAKTIALKKDEEAITCFIPLTNSKNSGFGSAGYTGMYIPKSQESKRYLNEFSDLRGNRLLVITTHRIIYLTVIEFLDDDSQYISYDFSNVKAMNLQPRKIEKSIKITSENNSYFVLNIATLNGHVYSDILAPIDVQALLNASKKNLNLAHFKLQDFDTKGDSLSFLNKNTNRGVVIVTSIFGVIAGSIGIIIIIKQFINSIIQVFK